MPLHDFDDSDIIHADSTNLRPESCYMARRFIRCYSLHVLASFAVRRDCIDLFCVRVSSIAGCLYHAVPKSPAMYDWQET